MPAYKIGKSVIVYFAAWKEHFSLYPMSDGVVNALGTELASYRVEKSTLRLPVDAEIPTELIARIAEIRKRELAR